MIQRTWVEERVEGSERKAEREISVKTRKEGAGLLNLDAGRDDEKVDKNQEFGFSSRVEKVKA